MNNIKLIVGLSNPGKIYDLTRHNVGSWYVKLLAKKYNKFLKLEPRFLGYTTKINFIDHNVHLLIPTTYMNLSGTSVLAIASFYRITATQILVAHDELDLRPGIAKIRYGSSNSSHKGIKNIINQLDHNFYRLRIGIGHPGNKQQVVDFVLNQPTPTEHQLITQSIDEAVRCTTILFHEGVDKAVNCLHAFKALT